MEPGEQPEGLSFDPLIIAAKLFDRLEEPRVQDIPRWLADCLVIAMPLCNQSLLDRLCACQAEGKPGIPRTELLRRLLAQHQRILTRPGEVVAHPRPGACVA